MPIKHIKTADTHNKNETNETENYINTRKRNTAQLDLSIYSFISCLA